ncbi:protein sorting system archaetidylserine decarboxylase [Halorarum salinum]|uniref:Protein sorting system archaetidylserine decarboxylase n=1 Tax=Halorarum salinum TaxID=2743089 RepID=A0A7D5L8P8_9EURY|nr:protein sorting system archaetidylserine decarboxylase [Halobaculum salinum]QLG60813.1 protein sorting system archaetidylserine decarboxylase [Halobaculum salinum]
MRLATGSRRYVLPPLLLGVPVLLIATPVGLALLALAGFLAWFFRDPSREPAGEGVLSPADGRVSVLREDGDRVRVGVFMSPFDVHVNRAPVGGEVTRIDHRGAAHRPAFSKESARNERVEYSLGDADGALIAGWFARRITPYVSRGESVARGERIGHIAFGSRADVVLPPEYGMADVRVRKGEKVRAGESIIARAD